MPRGKKKEDAAAAADRLAKLRVHRMLFDDRIAHSTATVHDALWAIGLATETPPLASSAAQKHAFACFAAANSWESRAPFVPIPDDLKFFLCSAFEFPHLRFCVSPETWEFACCAPRGEDYCMRFLDSMDERRVMATHVLDSTATTTTIRLPRPEEDGAAHSIGMRAHVGREVLLVLEDDADDRAPLDLGSLDADAWAAMAATLPRATVEDVFDDGTYALAFDDAVRARLRPDVRVRAVAASGVYWFAAWRRGDKKTRVYRADRRSGVAAAEYTFADHSLPTFLVLHAEDIGCAKGRWKSITSRYGGQFVGPDCCGGRCRCDRRRHAKPPPPSSSDGLLPRSTAVPWDGRVGCYRLSNH